MTEQTDKSFDEPHSTDAVVDGSFASQMRSMIAAFWTSQQRNKLILLAVALVFVVSATAYMQILLNAWNQPFYERSRARTCPNSWSSSAFSPNSRRSSRSQRRSNVAQSSLQGEVA